MEELQETLKKQIKHDGGVASIYGYDLYTFGGNFYFALKLLQQGRYNTKDFTSVVNLQAAVNMGLEWVGANLA